MDPKLHQDKLHACSIITENLNLVRIYKSLRFIHILTFVGTGKTHTMLGSQEDPGIMVHTLNSLFKKMDDTKAEMEYQVSMGYLEVYIATLFMNKNRSLRGYFLKQECILAARAILVGAVSMT